LNSASAFYIPPYIIWLKFISYGLGSQTKTALGRLAASLVLKQELLTALLTHQVQSLSVSQEFWSPY